MMERQESLEQQLLTGHPQADNRLLNALTRERSQDESKRYSSVDACFFNICSCCRHESSFLN